MQKEKWKRCAFEKDYLLSSWGRIYSIKSNNFLRPWAHKSRSGLYLRTKLGDKFYMVHVLMGHTFKKKELEVLKKLHPNMIYQVNHKDRNTLNPNLNNVEWTTEPQNKIHASETSSFMFGGKLRKGKMQ